MRGLIQAGWMEKWEKHGWGRANVVWGCLEISVCCRINSSLFIRSPLLFLRLAPSVDKKPQHPNAYAGNAQQRLPKTHLISLALPLPHNTPPPSFQLLLDISHPIFSLQPPFHVICFEFIRHSTLSYCCHTHILQFISHVLLFSLSQLSVFPAHSSPLFLLLSIIHFSSLWSFLSPALEASPLGDRDLVGSSHVTLCETSPINSLSRFISEAMMSVFWGLSGQVQRYDTETHHLSSKL